MSWTSISNPDTDRARAARDLLIAAAREAGELALGFFRAGEHTSADVQSKAGGSPVTAADLAADALLKALLSAAFPEAGWLSEETADNDDRLARRSLIIVDPIDGTRAFVAGDARWAVCVALVVDGRPIAGVVHAPALGETYAAARGEGATLNGAPLVFSSRSPSGGLTAAGPRPLLHSMGGRLGVSVDVAPRVPSLAYRLCMAARGVIDFAVAAADSHDWDVAAADLILEEAGGRLFDASGESIVYNTPRIRHGALLAASEALAPRLLDAFRGALSG